MEDLKTQTITFDEHSDTILTAKTQNSDLSLDNYISQTQKQTKVPDFKKIDTKKLAIINPNFTYFPSFYLSEIRRALFNMIAWIMINLVVIAGCSYLTWYIVTFSYSTWWLSFFLLPLIILAIAFLIVYIDKYKNLRNEAKTINFKNEKILSNNIRKLYLRVKTGYINVNWMACLAYVVAGLIILFTFIVVWAINVFDNGVHDALAFGTWIIQNDPGNLLPQIFIIASIVAISIAFILHVWLLVSSHLRTTKIESFYNCIIYTDTELTAIKKAKNRRDLIIFLATVAILVLLGFFIYKLIKNSKSNKGQIVVNN